MPESFLHGVEVVEITNGARSIQTVKSSIIGIVGTAPDAEGAVSATALVGSSSASLSFSASVAGSAGNEIGVRIVNSGTVSASLGVSVSEKVITVSLATDAAKTGVSTPAEVKTAIETDNEASALVVVTADGTGAIQPSPIVYLDGGKDVGFPVNTPVLVTPGDGLWARLGDAGTLSRAIDNIWKQSSTPVVVVRVEGATQAEAITAVAGSAGARTGIFALLDAESVTGYCPRILISPGFSNNQAVATSFVSVAPRLRAVMVLEGPNTTDADAVNYGLGFGSDRAYLVDPQVKVSRDEGVVVEGASSFAAGIIAQVDNDLGFWWSPSNKEIAGIVGTARAVDFTLGDSNARANLLNAANVATIIRQNGFRLWGNRTLSMDAKFAFLSVRRTADMINDSILRGHLWAVDRNITKTYVQDVAESVNAYLRSLIDQGALIGAQDVKAKINACWPDPDLNSAANIAAGKVYFNVAFTPPTPAERVSFRSEVNSNGLATIVS